MIVTLEDILQRKTKKYKVIYADPPWEISSIKLEKWKSSLSDKYETMSLSQIKQLPVKLITADNCSLFLWTTHTFLEKAFEVVKSWGFKYHVCITWDKGSGWCTNGFCRRTEFCLYGYKNNMNINQEGKFISTLIVKQKRKHSQKPLEMRELIESNTPQPRIELFARTQIAGWDAFGNQIPEYKEGLEV